MPVGPKNLPFFEHVEELRKRVIVIAVVLLLGSAGLYYWGWDIFDLVMAPVARVLKPGTDWVILNPWGAFGQRFTVAFYASVVVGSPIIIWQVMSFFLPALKPRERRYVIPTFIAMALLFVAGVAFCYLIILPNAFAWIFSQAGASISIVPDAKLYFQGVMLLIIGFGVGFELPVVVFYLVLFNIVPYEKLRKNWRMAYVLLMLVASLATPDWSLWTMGGLFGSLILLYEASLLLARVALSGRIKRQRELELAEDLDLAEETE